MPQGAGSRICLYRIQAAIAAVHAGSTNDNTTDWRQIVTLYDRLFEYQPTAVVALNRAVAISRADGPAAGLAAIEALDQQLTAYQPFHATRADLLAQLGSHADAIAAYDEAIARSPNAAERNFLERRRRELFRTNGVVDDPDSFL